MMLRTLRACINKLFTFALLLALTMLPVLLQAQSAPTTEELQKQIDELRAEIAALKASGVAPVPSAAPVAAAATITSPVAAPAPVDSLAGVSRVLGDATLTGFVDMYYGVNFNHSDPLPGNAAPAQFRVFDDRQNQFALNMAELVLDKTATAESRGGFRFALGFGRAMEQINTPDGGATFAQYLKEAYVSYLAPAGKGLQIDFGKFVTPHGAEVIETKDNWNYSRSLLFNYAIPFYHFGARAKYVFNDKVSLTGYLVNGWNNIIDNNTGKTGGFTLVLNPTKKLSLTQNYMVGPEQVAGISTVRHLSDTVVAYNLTPKLTLQGNFDYGRDRDSATDQAVYWTGGAGYIRYVVNPSYTLATRYEYFNDHYGFTTGTSQAVQEVTGTFERRFAGHLISRLEFRHDVSNQPSFLRGLRPVKDQNTFTVGMVYTLEKSE